MKTTREHHPRETEIGDLFKRVSYPLGDSNDLDPLINYIGDSKYVLLGEASHGTHEYYAWRARISKRLLAEKGFKFIAVEGDWPDCYRVNRYVKDYPFSGQSAYEVLHTFNRWPTWMWANWEVVAFTEWMKDFNKSRPTNQRVGFYGLDVYSHWEAMEAIICYLEKNDRSTLQTALHALNCFERYSSDEGHSYAHASTLVPKMCENEVVQLLSQIRKNTPRYDSDPEHVFSTEQNALVSVNAERYYHAMIKGGPLSWNARDKQMNSTLNRLMDFYGKDAKCLVWEHNTHVGDARATSMVDEGMVNLGQLVKEEHETEGVVTVGFGSYSGHVIAGRKWKDEMQDMLMPAAAKGSWEELLHTTFEGKNKLLMLHKIRSEERAYTQFGHRAIGVVYQPQYERYGNYVPSVLPIRYNAFLFLDKTTALNPLHFVPNTKQTLKTYHFGV
ncbi:MAG: erythromycin esterase family protein [bacterium]|nr:erythromycin esterase family protein [bacterium]